MHMNQMDRSFEIVKDFPVKRNTWADNSKGKCLLDIVCVMINEGRP